MGGATKRGITEAKAVEVFELMAKFADYGFNKSHAAAYALVAYQTAWMKTNHPVEFLAACMSLAINNTDKLAPHCVRKRSGSASGCCRPTSTARAPTSNPDVDADGKPAIRYALAAVKKVGMAAMQLARGGAWRTGRSATRRISASRIDPRQLNKMQIENLVRAGAMDGIAAEPRPVVRAAPT